MINFLPISILAYVLNGGSIIIDKILLQKSVSAPIVYTFYVGVLQLLALFLIPFGFQIYFGTPLFLSLASGVIFTLALYAFFSSLKLNEASMVGPVVGVLNPLFAAILGGLFLQQFLTTTQYLAILTLILGGLILTFNLIQSGLKTSNKLGWMILAGLLFALSYVLLRQAFLETTFINGLILSRLGAGGFALSFFIFPQFRQALSDTRSQVSKTGPKKVAILLFLGQLMGAVQGILLVYATSLANPALVNSLFGVQYLLILVVALIFSKNYPDLLDERLTSTVILQKILGVIILSFGLYLLSR